VIRKKTDLDHGQGNTMTANIKKIKNISQGGLDPGQDPTENIKRIKNTGEGIVKKVVMIRMIKVFFWPLKNLEMMEMTSQERRAMIASWNDAGDEPEGEALVDGPADVEAGVEARVEGGYPGNNDLEVQQPFEGDPKPHEEN
jgi:hypothetical protein